MVLLLLGWQGHRGRTLGGPAPPQAELLVAQVEPHLEQGLLEEVHPGQGLGQALEQVLAAPSPPLALLVLPLLEVVLGQALVDGVPPPAWEEEGPLPPRLAPLDPAPQRVPLQVPPEGVMAPQGQ